MVSNTIQHFGQLLTRSDSLLADHTYLAPRAYAIFFVVVVAEAQLRAASALRGLSVDEDVRTEIVARGALVPLLRLSNSDDVEIQMEVRCCMSPL